MEKYNYITPHYVRHFVFLLEEEDNWAIREPVLDVEDSNTSRVRCPYWLCSTSYLTHRWDEEEKATRQQTLPPHTQRSCPQQSLTERLWNYLDPFYLSLKIKLNGLQRNGQNQSDVIEVAHCLPGSLMSVIDGWAKSLAACILRSHSVFTLLESSSLKAPAASLADHT